jgi:KTSC domain
VISPARDLLLRPTDHCNVPEETASALIDAESAARFFNAHIRGKFVCGEGSGWRG